MTSEISSAHHRAATAFNDVASAARIAIEALAKIAAEPGRAIEIVEHSFSEIEVILRLLNRLSRPVRPWRVAILSEELPRNPHRQSAIAAARESGQRA